MPKMRGLGKDPLGRYPKGLIFDLADEDPSQVEDFERKGWAEVVAPEDHPGRTPTQIAASMVRGDELSDPTEAALAAAMEGREHAVVHLDDPDATMADYDAEVAAKKDSQKEFKHSISADSLGGQVARGARAKNKVEEQSDAAKQGS